MALTSEPYARGGILPPVGQRMLAADFFEYVGEHVIWRDGRIERWTGKRLVPCTGCDYPDHRTAVAAAAVIGQPQ